MVGKNNILRWRHQILDENLETLKRRANIKSARSVNEKTNLEDRLLYNVIVSLVDSKDGVKLVSALELSIQIAVNSETAMKTYWTESMNASL